MKNVKIFSMSLNNSVMDKVDTIVSEAEKMGVFVTRSHVVNTLLDSCTSDKSMIGWINYFRAEDEYKQQQKIMKRSGK